MDQTRNNQPIKTEIPSMLFKKNQYFGTMLVAMFLRSVSLLSFAPHVVGETWQNKYLLALESQKLGVCHADDWFQGFGSLHRCFRLEHHLFWITKCSMFCFLPAIQLKSRGIRELSFFNLSMWQRCKIRREDLKERRNGRKRRSWKKGNKGCSTKLMGKF